MKAKKMFVTRGILIFLAITLIFTCIAPATIADAEVATADLWVDPVNGSDSNTGLTEATALQSIQAAKVLAAEMSASGNVVVMLKGGTYSATTPITFGEAESGQNGNTITYKAASGETAIISGGTAITGWTLYDASENIYVADIPVGAENARQLYVDGEPQPNAYTETSPVDWTIMSSKGYSSPKVQSTTSNEYIIVDLGEARQVSCLTLYAGNEPDANGKAAGFPKDFTIETSIDGVNYDVQYQKSDYAAPEIQECIDFTFDVVSARFVKLNVTELGTPERLDPNKYSLALSEIKVGLSSTQTSAPQNISIAKHVDTAVNLLASDKIQIGYYGDGSTLSSFNSYVRIDASNMLDNNLSTFASTNAQIADWLTANGGGNTQAMVMDVSQNGSAVPISAIKLTVRSDLIGCPTNFDIQISTDDSTWVTVATESNYSWDANNTTAIIAFNPVKATKIRLLAHMTTIDTDNTHYYLQFAEMAVYRPANIANGASVIAPNEEIPDSSWSKDYLTDGVIANAYTSAGSPTATGLDAPVTLDLGSVQPMAGIRLYPRITSNGIVQYVRSVRIEVSQNNTDYSTVLNLSNIAAPAGDCQLFIFPEVQNARYVRVVPTEIVCGTGEVNYRFQLCEVEVVPPADTISEDDIVSLALSATSIENFGHQYGATGEYTAYTENTTSFPWSNLFDGNTETFITTMSYLMGWLQGYEDTADTLTPVLVINTSENGNPSLINTVELSARSTLECTPTHFDIQYTAANDENWITLASVQGETWTSSISKTITFAPVEAYKLRVVVYLLTPEGTVTEVTSTTNTRFQLSELAVSYVPTVENIIPTNIITQGSATIPGETHSIQSISVLHDNPEATYNANKLIDGYTVPTTDNGWEIPASWDFSNITSPTDVEVHVLNLWYHSIIMVTGVSSSGTEVYASANGRRPTWLANAYEFIDNPGEWYINRSAGKLYYKADGAMESKTVILPVTEQVIEMENCDNIIFDGIVFEHTSYTLPTEIGYEDAQANTQVYNGWTQVDGGIMVDSCENIVFTNCKIRNMGSAGIKIFNRSNNVSITNCAIYDISYSGIIAGEVSAHHGYQTNQLVTNTTIQNNYLTRVGLDMYDSPAVVVAYANGTLVDHNEIAYCPYSGISMGWGWDVDNDLAATEVGNNTISNNLVHDTGKTNRDGGSIYNLGSQVGSKIYGNYVYNSWDGKDTYENGIYLDQGSAHYEIYNNVIGNNVGYWMHMWINTIHDNYWHDNYHVSALALNESVNSTVENNTLVADGNFTAYPAAMTIINNAGLQDTSIKNGIAAGFAPEHNIVQDMYPDCNSRFIERPAGWSSVGIPNQISNTILNTLSYEITIVMPSGTDLSSLALTYELDEGWTCDKTSGSTQNFTSPVTYTLTNGDQTVTWTVSARLDAVASGTPEGDEVTLNNALQATSLWTVAPTAVGSDGSLTFSGSYTGYIGERFGNNSILYFNMTSNLSTTSKDWLAYTLRDQDPYTMTDTEYFIGFNDEAGIEVQKFVNGTRTVLYGDIDGYESFYGTLANSYYTANEEHSIVTGAIDVEDGVRIFLYIDGNKVFDIVDFDDPITTDGFFALYPMTQAITLSPTTEP